ncbi:MAG: hypothetical protein U5K72_02545 [Balneolaceae bacterium]|nr:hypothetical protein [Balneolaceae bacterium]
MKKKIPVQPPQEGRGMGQSAIAILRILCSLKGDLQRALSFSLLFERRQKERSDSHEVKLPVNGDITASFNNIGDNPMAFSNVQGDIDITLPSDAGVTAKMRSEWGEVYTDFQMEIDRSNRESIEADTDVYRVSINNWITGRINGGGPEYMFKTLRGDIYLRKR